MAGANVLASIPSPPAEFSKFSIGPLTIHAYALCILTGIVVAMWMTNKRWLAKGGPAEVVWDICIWAIPFGIVGGRLYHVLVTDPEYYFGLNGQSAHWSEIPQIWAGGLGIMGAISLGSLGAWIACRRAGVRLPAFLDAVAPGVLLAQAFGRWGNWFNQELFGRPTDLPWALEVSDRTALAAGFPPGTTFHPTFLYESLWCLGAFALVVWADRHFRLGHGRVVALYVMVYTLGRGWIEDLRIDDVQLDDVGGLRFNVWMSIVLFTVALAAFVVSARLRPGREAVVYTDPSLAPAAGEDADDGADEDADEVVDGRDQADGDDGGDRADVDSEEQESTAEPDESPST